MKEIERVLSREEIERMIERAETLRDKALIAFLYLTGARISEALQVKVEDMEIMGDWLLVSIITLKKKSVVWKKTKDGRFVKVKRKKEKPIRIVPLPLKDPMTQLIIAWAKRVETGRLWRFTRRWALEIVKRTAPGDPDVCCHLFRHTCLSHLVAYHDYGEYDLQKWTNWSDTRPAKRYIKLRWQDLARKLKNNQEWRGLAKKL